METIILTEEANSFDFRQICFKNNLGFIQVNLTVDFSFKPLRVRSDVVATYGSGQQIF